MTAQEALITLTKDGIAMLLSSVRAMPADKLDWKPEPDVRTVRSMLDEVISTMPWNTLVLREQKLVDFPDTGKESAPKSLPEYEQQILEQAKQLYAAIEGFPDDKLTETLTLPWGTMSFLDIMAYPYWNTMYHLGQVNYIQMRYGDTEMH